MFALDPAFLSSSEPIASLPLCEARLQNDKRYAWVILIPRRAGLVEIEDLPAADRARLMEEIVLAGHAVRAVDPTVEKLNVGALGNITPQLHVHVVGRRRGDPAWPGPVWGSGAALPYSGVELARALALAQASFGAG